MYLQKKGGAFLARYTTPLFSKRAVIMACDDELVTELRTVVLQSAGRLDLFLAWTGFFSF